MEKGILGLENILGILSPGSAFLAMIGVMALFVVGLLASGIVKVEVVNDEEPDFEKYNPKKPKGKAKHLAEIAQEAEKVEKKTKDKAKEG